MGYNILMDIKMKFIVLSLTFMGIMVIGPSTLFASSFEACTLKAKIDKIGESPYSKDGLYQIDMTFTAQEITGDCHSIKKGASLQKDVQINESVGVYYLKELIENKQSVSLEHTHFKSTDSQGESFSIETWQLLGHKSSGRAAADEMY